MTLAALLDHLPADLAARVRATLDADQDAPELHPTPWQAALVMRFGALIGGIALLSCLGLLLSDALEDIAIGLGPLCSAAGLLLYRAAPRALRDLLHQTGLLLHWTGAILFAIGLMQADVDVRPFAAVWMVWETVAIALWPDTAQRGMSAVGWMAALMVLVAGEAFVGGALQQALCVLPAFAAAGLWAAQPALARKGHTELVEPIASAWTVMGLSTVLPADAFGRREVHVASTLAALLFAGSVGWLAMRPGLERSRVALAALTVAVLPATWLAPGVGTAGALGLLLVERGRRGLAGATVAGLGLNVIWLYYAMNLPFSAKAGAMAATGVALWLASLLSPPATEAS